MTCKYETELANDWSNLSYIEALSRDLECLQSYPEAVQDAVAFVSMELVENALKHGEKGKSISYRLDSSGREVVVEVTNELPENYESSVATLDETVQLVRGFHNPQEALAERLRHSSRYPDAHVPLGIIRISSESRAIVDFYLNESNQISVSAVIQV